MKTTYLYWKLLVELNSNKVTKSETMFSSNWIKYFSYLNEQNRIPNSNVMDKLKDLENEKLVNELAIDYLISEKEISKSIKERKK